MTKFKEICKDSDGNVKIDGTVYRCQGILADAIKQQGDEIEKLKRHTKYLEDWRVSSSTTMMSLAHILKSEYSGVYVDIRNRMIEIGAL